MLGGHFMCLFCAGDWPVIPFIKVGMCCCLVSVVGILCQITFAIVFRSKLKMSLGFLSRLSEGGCFIVSLLIRIKKIVAFPLGLLSLELVLVRALSTI